MRIEELEERLNEQQGTLGRYDASTDRYAVKMVLQEKGGQRSGPTGPVPQDLKQDHNHKRSKAVEYQIPRENLLVVTEVVEYVEFHYRDGSMQRHGPPLSDEAR